MSIKSVAVAFSTGLFHGKFLIVILHTERILMLKTIYMQTSYVSFAEFSELLEISSTLKENQSASYHINTRKNYSDDRRRQWWGTTVNSRIILSI